MANYGKRPDGTEKGLGYYGELPNANGKGFSTELSAWVNYEGKDVLVPLLVPGMAREQIDHLVNGGKMTKEIVDHAVDFAMPRLKAGMSPFASPKEEAQTPLPPSADEAFKQGFEAKD